MPSSARKKKTPTTTNPPNSTPTIPTNTPTNTPSIEPSRYFLFNCFFFFLKSGVCQYIQHPEPDRDQVSSINASSRVLPVHAGRDIPTRTGIYSLALVLSRGQGQESCLVPWSGSRERAKTQVLDLFHTASPSTSPWYLLLGFSTTLGRLLGPVRPLLG